MKQDFVETKQDRVLRKLETISNLYNLVFEIENLPKDIKKLKISFSFSGDEKDIILACKTLGQQIQFLIKEAGEKHEEVYFTVSKRLIEIFKQYVNVIREEFRTLRERNSRLPDVEQYIL